MGVGYHCQNDRKVIPPKSTDDEDASEQAEEQEENHKDEEESGEAVDGRFPVALGRGHGPNPSLWQSWSTRVSSASSLRTSGEKLGFLRGGIAEQMMPRILSAVVEWPALRLHLPASIISYRQR